MEAVNYRQNQGIATGFQHLGFRGLYGHITLIMENNVNEKDEMDTGVIWMFIRLRVWGM